MVLLDAKLEEVVMALEHSEMNLTPPQVDGLLRDVVRQHPNKLERLTSTKFGVMTGPVAVRERASRATTNGCFFFLDLFFGLRMRPN